MNNKSNAFLRPIQASDNAAVADIIRTVMTEFGAVGKGYSIEDPEVDAMYEAYLGERSVYYVVVLEDEVLGCGGIAPLRGGDADTCELKKMYFKPALRGLGMGRKLVEQLLEDARKEGYKHVYLETIPKMETANLLYKKTGFRALDGSVGNTGHTACGAFYMFTL
jgi:putative acetyltransferase